MRNKLGRFKGGSVNTLSVAFSPSSCLTGVTGSAVVDVATASLIVVS